MTSIFPKTILGGALLLAALSAHAQFSTMNIVYTDSNLPLNMNTAKRADMERLRSAGVNTILIGGYSYQEVSSKLSAARNDPTLSKFNYVLNIAGPLHDTSTILHKDVCNSGAAYLTAQDKSLIENVTNLAKQNADKVVGYYTFDEPALAGREICKEYQVLARNYIRAMDGDVVGRPVMLANTPWSLTDEIYSRTMSNDAQDAMLWVEYDVSQGSLSDSFQKLKRNGFKKPLIHILPAHGSSCNAADLKGVYQNSVEAAISGVYGTSAPVTLGLSYFAYWPDNKPDFNFSMDNCSSMMNAVTEHLAGTADLVVSRIDTVPQNPLVGQAVSLSVEIKNIGKKATSSSYLGVVVLVDDVCPSSGCFWGIVDRPIAPGESRIVSINGNENWQATAGNHKLTALADEGRNLIEANRDNNTLSKIVSVPVPPAMTLQVIPQQVKAGQTVTRYWNSQNTTSCFSKTGDPLATSGTWQTVPLYSSNTYQISCSGPGGTVTQSVDVTVVP